MITVQMKTKCPHLDRNRCLPDQEGDSLLDQKEKCSSDPQDSFGPIKKQSMSFSVKRRALSRFGRDCSKHNCEAGGGGENFGGACANLSGFAWTVCVLIVLYHTNARYRVYMQNAYNTYTHICIYTHMYLYICIYYLYVFLHLYTYIHMCPCTSQKCIFLIYICVYI